MQIFGFRFFGFFIFRFFSFNAILRGGFFFLTPPPPPSTLFPFPGHRIPKKLRRWTALSTSEASRCLWVRSTLTTRTRARTFPSGCAWTRFPTYTSSGARRSWGWILWTWGSCPTTAAARGNRRFSRRWMTSMWCWWRNSSLDSWSCASSGLT